MFSKGESSGYRSKKIDVVNRNDYEYNQAPQSNDTNVDSTSGEEEKEGEVDLT